MPPNASCAASRPSWRRVKRLPPSLDLKPVVARAQLPPPRRRRSRYSGRSFEAEWICFPGCGPTPSPAGLGGYRRVPCHVSLRRVGRRRRAFTLRQRRARLVLLRTAGARRHGASDGVFPDYPDDGAAPQPRDVVLRPAVSEPGHHAARRVRQPHRIAAATRARTISTFSPSDCGGSRRTWSCCAEGPPQNSAARFLPPSRPFRTAKSAWCWRPAATSARASTTRDSTPCS